MSLLPPVTSDDRMTGHTSSPITLVEFGDYECPYCRQAAPIVQAMLADRSLEFRYVFRNYPLVDLHANAMNAALVAESAADDVFWKLHLALFENQGALDPERLIAYAVKAGVPEARARNGLHGSTRPKVEGDLSSGERSGVQGTPAFFVNGRRHDGDWSHGSLADAIARVGA